MEIPESIRSAVETVVRSWYDDEKIRDVTVESWVDDIGDDALKVHVFVDPDTKREDLGPTMVGLHGKIMNVLKGGREGTLPVHPVDPHAPGVVRQCLSPSL